MEVLVTGVLKYKRQSEELLMQSGLPYTILRPGRLTDGPYTSYDLNTLLQATAGTRQDIQVAAGDELNGETSRIALAGVPHPDCSCLFSVPSLTVRQGPIH